MKKPKGLLPILVLFAVVSVIAGLVIYEKHAASVQDEKVNKYMDTMNRCQQEKNDALALEIECVKAAKQHHSKQEVRQCEEDEEKEEAAIEKRCREVQ